MGEISQDASLLYAKAQWGAGEFKSFSQLVKKSQIRSNVPLFVWTHELIILQVCNCPTSSSVSKKTKVLG